MDVKKSTGGPPFLWTWAGLLGAQLGRTIALIGLNWDLRVVT
jgi:uncharacterized protein (TIGR03382 family)